MKAALLLCLVACGSSTPPAAPPKPASPLAPFESWVGDWQGDDGATEHWFAAGGAVFGVWFKGDEFTVKIVDDGEGTGKADGVLRYITIPNGTASTEANAPDAEFSHVKTYKRFTAPRAEELEAVDTEFATDTGASGVDGWMKHFAPTGGQLRKGKRIEGDAIREAMSPLFADGTLAWAPLVGKRPSQTSKLGFTVGTAKFMSKTPGEDWASAYITIWQQQPDGSWKVTFDTGRPTQQE